jgi:hypothetical protein
VLQDYTLGRSLSGNSTQLFFEGCAPSAGPGSGVCVVTKSTGALKTFTNGRYGATSPLAADDVSLWFSPGGILNRAPLSGGAGDSLYPVQVNAIATQLGTSAPVTYFAQAGGLLVASTPTSTPIAIAASPGGDLVVVGGTIAYVLELAGKVHRFDVVGRTALDTVDVGALAAAAWSTGALYFTQPRVASTPGSMKRLDDGTREVTNLFDIASPDLVAADGDALYYLDQGAPGASLGASVRRSGKTPGAASSVIADGFSSVSGLSIDDACVYFFATVPDPASAVPRPSLRVYPKR